MILGIGINVNTAPAELSAIERPLFPASSLMAQNAGRARTPLSLRRRAVGTGQAAHTAVRSKGALIQGYRE